MVGNVILIVAVTLNFPILSTSLPHDVVFRMVNPRPEPPKSPPLEFQEYYNPSNISQPCFDAFNRTIISALRKLLNNGTLTLEVPDSFGKPGAGIRAGNINMLGHFDECVSVPDFKYCLAYFNVSSLVKDYPTPLLYGLCSPQVCTDYDVFRIITDIETMLPLESVVCTRFPHQPFTWQFGLTVAFFSLLFITAVLSSLYFAWYHSPACRHREGFVPLDDQGFLGQDGPLRHEEPDLTGEAVGKEGAVAYNEPTEDIHLQARPEGKVLRTLNKVLFSFALPQNLPKLLSAKVSKDSIDCLHGIRVISMLWVILGHVFSFVASVAIINPLTGIDWFKRYGFLTVSNAFFSVDSFFVLSGLLVTYLTMKQMKKRNGRIPWRWFYFHRYWRLTPALALTMLFWIYLTPYFGYGPYAQAASQSREACKQYWWTNILYINNFYPVKGEEGCILWVWYLANDMQFFAISPLILIPLYHIPWLGMCFIAVLCMASMVVTGALVGINDFPVAALQFQINPQAHGTFTDVIYFKPYCRITPYLVGMVLGYIFYKYPKKSIKIHWLIALLSWILACGVGYACIYCVYGNYNGHLWSTAANIIYEALARFAWGAALAWIIFACHYGYGGWVNSLLGHPGWAPLSRLTFCAYLLHPIIIQLFVSHQGSTMYLSLALTGFYFAGIALISYGCAAIFSLLVEFPLVSLEKLFIPRA